MVAKHIEDYYLSQAGSGAGQFYAGSANQKGYGIGGFLGGLFRTIMPFLRSGAKAVSREALRAGSHILADAASGEQPLSVSVKRHAGEVRDNLMKKLSNKMSGSGIKRKRLTESAQSKRSKAGVNNVKKRSVHRDIFSL